MLGLWLLVSLAIGCTRAPTSPQVGEGPATPVGPAPKNVTSQNDGWESSGGGGVACFETPAAAEAGQREKIVSVVTLESWENAKDWKYSRLEGKTRDEILALVRAQLAEHAPIFYSRLKLVENHIAYRTWQPTAALPRIEDATPKLAVAETDPKCRVVQLAVRYTKSKKGFLPEARVEVDQFLFDRLAALDQAMLILHEEIYLMGRELVHKSSDSLRRTIAILFSDELAADTARLEAREKAAKAAGVKLIDPHIPSSLINGQINAILGDYYLYFNSDPLDKPATVPAISGQYSRWLAFGRMLEKGRARKHECLEKKKYDEQSAAKKARIYDECSAEALNPVTFEPLLDDEEAFVFTARWVLDRVRVTRNSEHLVVWNRQDPAAISDVQRTELENACAGIPTLDLPFFAKLLEKSARYCATLPK